MTQIGKNNQINREAWLEATLKKIPVGLTILDAGAGELKYKKYCSHLNYVSQDFAQYDGQGDGAGQQTHIWDQTKLDIISDIVSIPRDKGSFDAIMCIEVLEHIPDPAKAIKEFSRLLKIGGTVIITSPFVSMTHMSPYHFATGFNKYFYEEHLKSNGFEIIEMKQNGNYFEFFAQELRRLPWVVDRYANYTLINMSAIRKLYYKVISFIYRNIILKPTLKIIDKYNKIDTGSDEFSGFGYHVFARKIK